MFPTLSRNCSEDRISYGKGGAEWARGDGQPTANTGSNT